MRRFPFLFLLAWAGVSCSRPSTSAPPAPPEVRVIQAGAVDVPVAGEWVASLDGTVNAAIRAQVAGYLLRQAYTEGAAVRAGDLLFEIDSRPLRAARAQARAQLAQAEAQLGKTHHDVERYRALAASEAISRQELDTAVQANLAAQAQVEAARAALQQAEIDLGFAQVRAPIDGVAGRALAAVGDLVGPSAKELTTISRTDPIRAYFTPSEQEYLSYLARHRDGSAAASARELRLELVLADGSVYAQPGRFAFVDRQVDARTGAVTVAGDFPNPGGVLRPGMFARVRAVLETRRQAVVIPQRAVSELQGTYQVLVVAPDGKVAVRAVKTGPRLDRRWVIDEGLKAGETVIVEGIQKARPGSVVRTAPFEMPAVAAAAQP